MSNPSEMLRPGIIFDTETPQQREGHPIPEETIRKILETDSRGIIQFDLSGRVTYMNKTAHDLAGNPGDPSALRPILDPGNPSAEVISRSIQGDSETPDQSTSYIHKIKWIGEDGKTVPTLTQVIHGELGTTIIFEDQTAIEEQENIANSLREALHKVNNALAVPVGLLDLLPHSDELSQSILADAQEGLEKAIGTISAMQQVVRSIPTHSTPSHTSHPLSSPVS